VLFIVTTAIKNQVITAQPCTFW